MFSPMHPPPVQSAFWLVPGFVALHVLLQVSHLLSPFCQPELQVHVWPSPALTQVPCPAELQSLCPLVHGGVVQTGPPHSPLHSQVGETPMAVHDLPWADSMPHGSSSQPVSRAHLAPLYPVLQAHVPPRVVGVQVPCPLQSATVLQLTSQLAPLNPSLHVQEPPLAEGLSQAPCAPQVLLQILSQAVPLYPPVHVQVPPLVSFLHVPWLPQSRLTLQYGDTVQPASAFPW